MITHPPQVVVRSDTLTNRNNDVMIILNGFSILLNLPPDVIKYQKAHFLYCTEQTKTK
jgi:hypothetical protein